MHPLFKVGVKAWPSPHILYQLAVGHSPLLMSGNQVFVNGVTPVSLTDSQYQDMVALLGAATTMGFYHAANGQAQAGFVSPQFAGSNYVYGVAT